MSFQEILGVFLQKIHGPDEFLEFTNKFSIEKVVE
jgi:hypothetical protein